MTEPDDRELQDYLKGGSRLSRAYRQAGNETPPPELDEAILARARAEARRKPDWGRALAPYALAASVLLGLNLAWNIHQEAPREPVPMGGRVAPAARTQTAAAPPAEAAAKRAAPTQERAAGSGTPAARATAEADENDAARERRSLAAPGAAADAASAGAPAPADPAATIEALIDDLGALQGARFVDGDTELDVATAAARLRECWRAAGTRVRSAPEFIGHCATAAVDGGPAYQIRHADGRLEPAAGFLRARLRERED